MKKLITLTLTLLMTLSLSTTAFAAAPPETDYEPITTEFATDKEALPTAPDEIYADDRFEDMACPPIWETPIRDTRNWLAEQVRLQPDGYDVNDDGTISVRFVLTDATKIIFIVDQVCPTRYDEEDGSLWKTGFSIPCGISMRAYRFLDMVDRLAATYDEDAAGQLVELYSSEELAGMYAELRELAPASYANLIDWLDNFSLSASLFVPSLTETNVIAPTPCPGPDTPIVDDYPDSIGDYYGEIVEETAPW